MARAEKNVKQEDLFEQIDETQVDQDSAFMIDLEFFEGPIELLLNLVKKTKIPIMEVRLADITDAYLAEIEAKGVLDMDNAAAFVTVATMLIEIKAKSMLPDITDFIEEAPARDPETLLKIQMQKYELFKEASEKLKTHEEINMFFKAPEEGATDERIVLGDMKLDALLDAFAKMLHKAEIKQKVATPRRIVKDRFTVADKMAQMRTILKERGTVEFTELFESDYSRGEIITTFQAMLELIKLQWIAVAQDDIFGKIDLRYKGEGVEASSEEIREDTAS